MNDTNMHEPKRYQVTITTFDPEETYNCSVITWFNEAKAVSIAMGEHNRVYEKNPVYKVSLKYLGSPDIDENGVAMIRPEELIDRREW